MEDLSARASCSDGGKFVKGVFERVGVGSSKGWGPDIRWGRGCGGRMARGGLEGPAGGAGTGALYKL